MYTYLSDRITYIRIHTYYVCTHTFLIAFSEEIQILPSLAFCFAFPCFAIFYFIFLALQGRPPLNDHRRESVAQFVCARRKTFKDDRTWADIPADVGHLVQ